VDLANQPGELARLCEAIAGRGINLVLSAIAREDGGTVAFIADDEAGAQEVLDGAGLQYAMRPALTIRMENQPGTGATARTPGPDDETGCRPGPRARVNA